MLDPVGEWCLASQLPDKRLLAPYSFVYQFPQVVAVLVKRSDCPSWQIVDATEFLKDSLLKWADLGLYTTSLD